MPSIFVILTLCHVLGQVTVSSAGPSIKTELSCAPVEPEMQITLLVDLPSLISFLATPRSGSSGSTKYTYSKEYINCTETNGDCSAQVCCRDKKPTCNKSTEKCDCLDSSNKFTGRPLVYIKNSGKCGVQGAGCTICMDSDGTVGNRGVGHMLPGLLGNKNVSSVPKDEDTGNDLNINVGLNGAADMTGDLETTADGVITEANNWITVAIDTITIVTDGVAKMIGKHNH